MKNAVFLFLSSLFAFYFSAESRAGEQNFYRLYFKDRLPEKKSDSERAESYVSEQTLRNRLMLGLPLIQESDKPVEPVYLNVLEQIQGLKVLFKSKWLHSVSAELSPEAYAKVVKLPFIRAVEAPDGHFHLAKVQEKEKTDFAPALEQIRAKYFNDLSAETVLVGVIDAGFYGAADNNYLSHLFSGERIKEVRDYVNPQKTDHYGKRETGMDDHGTTVLEMLAGKKENKNRIRYKGLAGNADFYLARTDHGNREARTEEDAWIAALEWMDSLGVRLVNTSLGYTEGFDNKEENYKREEMDGKTAVSTKAATIAARKKGMILICSAGNEGNGSWRYLSAPADAAEVLSVGATRSSGIKAGYSSIGSPMLSYVKPDVSCFSNFGTSFSAPVITGVAACMLQERPDLTWKETFEMLRKCSGLYPYANNYIGYGVPQLDRLRELMKGKKTPSLIKEQKVKHDQFTFTLKDEERSESIIIFHKSDKQSVIDQKFVGMGHKVTIKRENGAKRSTIFFGKRGYEIIWK